MYVNPGKFCWMLEQILTAKRLEFSENTSGFLVILELAEQCARTIINDPTCVDTLRKEILNLIKDPDRVNRTTSRMYEILDVDFLEIDSEAFVEVLFRAFLILDLPKCSIMAQLLKMTSQVPSHLFSQARYKHFADVVCREFHLPHL